ncbi:hypothetical protein [Goodfellowiella coeruleoviolacea]|uniref:Lipoprotein n=1 Tax=Goodfellowiella coeruleoviolacea TaxID=334858 RepID=A0AAE3KFH8_9PSEU|nr:hypothetical protein [Goodfellowiella coeruleoviolacea]MCP2164434.1 hypothetical protein [Goodfellowiella coeruleoviolacea]
MTTTRARMTPILLAAVCLAGVAGCSQEQAASHARAHQHHVGQTGTATATAGAAALGQSFGSLPELWKWVQDSTGECADARPASRQELADYLGPTRISWYDPYVAEWAVCGVAPYDRLGLVLFKPDQQRALEEFWKRGVDSGELQDNSDWAFGNGFAVTAGPLGVEELGLHYLWCEPVDDPQAHRIPADVAGCDFAMPQHEH